MATHKAWASVAVKYLLENGNCFDTEPNETHAVAKRVSQLTKWNKYTAEEVKGFGQRCEFDGNITVFNKLANDAVSG